MKLAKEIKIVINKNSKLYNQFNDSKLSDELHQYIYNQFRGISLKTDIFITIHHKFKLTEQEKIKLVDEIRENYGLDVKENLLKLKFETYKQIILLLTGIILLMISHFIEADYLYLVSQLFSIFGWVIIWEYIYSLVFFNIKTRYENKRFIKLINAKIKFKEIK